MGKNKGTYFGQGDLYTWIVSNCNEVYTPKYVTTIKCLRINVSNHFFNNYSPTLSAFQ